MQVTVKCKYCDGTGKFKTVKCPRCGGTGKMYPSSDHAFDTAPKRKK